MFFFFLPKMKINILRINSKNCINYLFFFFFLQGVEFLDGDGESHVPPLSIPPLFFLTHVSLSFSVHPYLSVFSPSLCLSFLHSSSLPVFLLLPLCFSLLTVNSSFFFSTSSRDNSTIPPSCQED